VHRLTFCPHFTRLPVRALRCRLHRGIGPDPIDRFGATSSELQTSRMGRYREFGWKRSGRRRRAVCLACVQWQQYLEQLTFGPAPLARTNDCLVPGSVSKPAAGDRLQTLQNGHPRRRVERLQRVASERS
jgi:hypothetical protein